MVSFKIGLGMGTLIAAVSLAAMPLAALTMRECSAAYKSAQKSGALGGMSWQEFRKAKCAPGAEAAPAVGPSPGGSGYLPGGRAIFPMAIAPKYSDQTPGKGRRQTCLDQYRINKASNANGGLKWVQRGGGYYSECNKRLKAGWKG
jgi:hypothetical protein